MSILLSKGHNDQQQFVTDLEAENASLRHQVQSQTVSIQTHEHNRNIIEKLRTDNEMLSQALNNVGGELEEVIGVIMVMVIN